MKMKNENTDKRALVFTKKTSTIVKKGRVPLEKGRALRPVKTG
jgi:hypothetical protein